MPDKHLSGQGLALRKMTRALASLVGLLLAASALAAPCPATEYVEGLEDWPVMSLQAAVKLGLEQNFDLQAAALNPAVAEQGVIVEEARFDPALDAAASAQGNRQPQELLFSDESGKGYAAEGGLSKEFASGLDARLALQSWRSSGNLRQAERDPEYVSALVLDLSQPLLRDFGPQVNTTDLQVARIQRRQALLGYADQAQRIAEAIEVGYYDLAQAIEIYGYRIESRDLARELVEGNREKLEVGIIPVSELQEAQTAVAARDEQVLLARQQVETAGNRLKDLLGIMQEYPLSRNFYRTAPLPEVDREFPQLEPALNRALKDRPDLQGTRLAVETQDLRLEFDRNQTLPRLDLLATLGINGLSGDPGAEGGTQRDYIDSFDGLAAADGYQWFTGVSFSYPLGNRAAKARLERTRLGKRQAIYGVKRLETTVETEVINTLIQVRRSLERVGVAGRFEELADSTLEQEMERLQEGLSDTFRILDFQDDVIDARIRRVTALADFHKGLAGLYRAMGGNLQRLGITVTAFDEELSHAQK